MYPNVYIFWGMLDRAVMGYFISKNEEKNSKRVCRRNFIFLLFNPLFYVWTMHRSFKNISAKFQSRSTFLGWYFFHKSDGQRRPKEDFLFFFCLTIFLLGQSFSTILPHLVMLVMLKLETRFVNILIGCFYRRPSAPTSFWRAVDQQLEKVLGVEHHPPTLLTGDHNVDILDTKHPHYNHLHSFLAAHHN